MSASAAIPEIVLLVEQALTGCGEVRESAPLARTTKWLPRPAKRNAHVALQVQWQIQNVSQHRSISVLRRSLFATECSHIRCPNPFNLHCSPHTHATGTACVAEPCPAGRYHFRGAVRGVRVCKQCSAGHYQPKPGQKSCRACAKGQHSAEGQSKCTLCDKDHIFLVSRGAGTCACRPGSFRLRGDSACHKCPDGTYQPAAGSKSCHRCPLGSKANFARTACMQGPCQPGRYHERGSRRCTKCSSGRFQDRSGQSFCHQCPAGTLADSSHTMCIRYIRHGDGARTRMRLRKVDVSDR